MTPETKTPTRAEALAGFSVLQDRKPLSCNPPDTKYEVLYKGKIIAKPNYAFWDKEEQMFCIGWEGYLDKPQKHIQWRLYKEPDALATDASIVEGLDEALTRYEQDGIIYDDQDHNDRMIEPLYEAARLYAQGRTQSAVPEGLFPDKNGNGGFIQDLCFTVWQLCHNPKHEDGNTDWFNDTKPTVMAGIEKIKAMLSAAPPVTGGAWLPIDTAPKDGTRVIVNFRRHGPLTVTWEPPATRDDDPIWCVDDFKFGPYAVRGYCDGDDLGWQPLPAPPSSAEREGV